MIHMALLGLLSVLAVAQNLFYWNFLPERVAIHFGANGQPDNWLDKDRATMLMMLLQIGLPWMMVGIAYGIRYLPASAINIPNREYWLQPERRAATLKYVSGMLGTIAIAESLLIGAMNHLSFNANRLGQPLNTATFVVVLALFMAVVLGMVVASFRRFGGRLHHNPAR